MDSTFWAKIFVFFAATAFCASLMLNLILVLKTPEHRYLYWTKRLGGAYWKHPTYPPAYYEVGAKLTVVGVMVQLVVIDLMLFLALFDYPLFTSIVGGG